MFLFNLLTRGTRRSWRDLALSTEEASANTSAQAAANTATAQSSVLILSRLWSPKGIRRHKHMFFNMNLQVLTILLPRHQSTLCSKPNIPPNQWIGSELLGSTLIFFLFSKSSFWEALGQQLKTKNLIEAELPFPKDSCLGEHSGCSRLCSLAALLWQHLSS